MFVTAENFVTPPFDLPNLDQGDLFENFIEEQEEKVLKEILGRYFTSKIIDGLTVVSPAVPAERWTKLKNGEDYVINGITYHWDGFEKLFTPYIYAMWLKQTVNSTSANGVLETESENSIKVSPAVKFSEAFNTFSELVGDYDCLEDTLYGYLYSKNETFAADVTDAGYGDLFDYLNNQFEAPGFVNSVGI